MCILVCNSAFLFGAGGRRLLLGVGAALLTGSRQPIGLLAGFAPAATQLPADSGSAPLVWSPGTLPPTDLLVPPARLHPLRIVKSGVPIYKSNNPEVFSGTGWLMQNARRDARRGGRRRYLAGRNVLYLFHINKSGTPKYLHVLAANPSTRPTSVTYRGSCYTNATFPLTGAATGQSYHVAHDWLTGTFPVAGTTGDFGRGMVQELFRTALANSNMVDGRLEVTSTKPTVYYVVVTAGGTLAEATAAAQGAGAAGEYYPEDANRFGREAGIYASSEVSADNTLDLPAGPAYLGFCLNTTSKFAPVENQTADSLMTLKAAASRTYGNYGHHYRLTFRLRNATSTSRKVRVYFASNATNPARSNATWNGPVRADTTIVAVYTTLNKPRVVLSEWTIAPGQGRHTIEFYVPGLITTNQQLIFQVM